MRCHLPAPPHLWSRETLSHRTSASPLWIRTGTLSERLDGDSAPVPPSTTSVRIKRNRSSRGRSECAAHSHIMPAARPSTTWHASCCGGQHTRDVERIFDCNCGTNDSYCAQCGEYLPCGECALSHSLFSFAHSARGRCGSRACPGAESRPFSRGAEGRRAVAAPSPRRRRAVVAPFFCQ